MTTREVFVSYDHEGDMVEVLWAFRDGCFTPTYNERILASGRRLRGHRVPHP